MILANGVPKAGTHALMTTLALLGLRREPGILIVPNHKRSTAVKSTRSDRKVRKLEPVLNDPDNGLFLHSHIHDDVSTGRARMINIRRDPRAVLISYARYQVVEGLAKTANRDDVRACIRSYYGQGIVPIHQNFFGWLDNPRVLNIRFEDLCGDGGETVARILKWLNRAPKASVVEAAYNGLCGASDVNVYKGAAVDGSTWSGKLTNWQEWWDSNIQSEWHAVGGPALVRALGYDAMAAF